MRLRKTGGEGIFERGILGLEIVEREIDVAVFAERCAGVLEVCGHVHSVVDATTATYHSVFGKRVGEAGTRSEVVAVHWNVTIPCTAQDRGSEEVGSIVGRGDVHAVLVEGRCGNADSAASGEVAVLNAIVALCIRIAPFITQPESEREFGVTFQSSCT